ncbi:MAG: hypothetical protein LCH86_07690 [Proteobacteria bacterium]|nr:hypothetical protein [Pseudomonadota bacterium]
MFNNIPGNIVAPIIAFEVNSGGQFESQSRLLLIGHKTSVGSMAVDTPVPCQTERDARALAGAGSMLDDMFRIARRNAPGQEIWIGAVAPTGTANARTLTVGDVPAGGGIGVIEIAGEPVQLTIAPGDTANAVAAALGAAINAYFNPLNDASLPVTATVAGGVVTCTNRHLGAHGAEVDFNIPALATGNAFAGALTVAISVAGSGAPSLTGLLAALGDDPFDWPVSGFGDDGTVAAFKALLNDVSGRWAWSRQIYGHAFYPKTDTSGNLTTHGLAQDDRHISPVARVAGGGYSQPSWQFVAAYSARIVPWLSDGANGNVSRNQTGLQLIGIAPPRDRAFWPNHASRNAWLVSGLSTWSVDAAGRVLIDKAITTQRTTLGVTDTTFRDIQKIGQVMYALRRFRAALTYEHGQKAIADDNPGNIDTVSTPREIAATMVHTYRDLVNSGVLENVVAFGASLKVARDADNPNRINIVAPLDTTNPLDVIGANAVIYSQFRNAA